MKMTMKQMKRGVSVQTVADVVAAAVGWGWIKHRSYRCSVYYRNHDSKLIMAIHDTTFRTEGKNKNNVQEMFLICKNISDMILFDTYDLSKLTKKDFDLMGTIVYYCGGSAQTRLFEEGVVDISDHNMSDCVSGKWVVR